jgi:hypothetical protein
VRTMETQPGMKALVAEAVRALAKLDAEKLEELACSCSALNCEPGQAGNLTEAHETEEEMAALARALESTRANLDVMNRLRDFHASRMEYSVVQSAALQGLEALHGVR